MSSLEDSAETARIEEAQSGSDPKRGRLLAAGGVVGAFLASSCCIVPLVLVTLGISGSWISNLTAMEPYKPYVATITLGFIGMGFWHVYFKPRKACEGDSHCARPASSRLTKTALWLGTVIVLLAITINYWAPLLY